MGGHPAHARPVRPAGRAAPAPRPKLGLPRQRRVDPRHLGCRARRRRPARRASPGPLRSRRAVARRRSGHALGPAVARGPRLRDAGRQRAGGAHRGDVEHRGRLEPVTWEDRPDAIITGREELGWYKVYADTMTRHTGDDGKCARYLAAWGGTRFFALEVTLGRGLPTGSSWRKGPLMHYERRPETCGAMATSRMSTSCGARSSAAASRGTAPPRTRR